MVDTTQKQEALQAVRLLFVAACGGGSSDHKNPETLYRARQMLEAFIESAGVLESVDNAKDGFVYQGVSFTLGDRVSVRQPDNSIVEAEIIRVIPQHELVSVENLDMRCTVKWVDLISLNPQGSHK